MERDKISTASPKSYGSTTYPSADACPVCPTCRGTGRIPRGHSEMLVAVIPCNDHRLRPRRTKLYVCVSMAMCLFVCCLILFFLFPRSLDAAAGTLQSAIVYLRDDRVDVEITKVINISNQNYAPVEIVELNVQGLVVNSIVGKSTYHNLTRVESRSQNSYMVKLYLSIKDKELRITMNVSYISHGEQVSFNGYDYFDCAHNSTEPRLTGGGPSS